MKFWQCRHFWKWNNRNCLFVVCSRAWVQLCGYVYLQLRPCTQWQHISDKDVSIQWQ